MADILIEEESGDAAEGRYVARVSGVDGEAELVYKKLAADLVNAVHTEAPASLRGSGAAAALVDRLVSDARQRGFRIVPTCDYVRSRYEKHPEWSDVFVEDTP